MRWLLAATLLGCAPPAELPAADEPTEPTDPSPPTDAWAPAPPDRERFVDCVSLVEWDAGGDGVVDLTETTTHDALGWPVRVEKRALEHGSAQIETWTGRNAWGLYTRRELDDDGDGAADLVEEGAFDRHLWRWTTADEGADGWIDLRVVHENEGGLRRGSAHDEGDDGTVDVAVTYGYDAQHRPILEAWDRGVDGTIDATRETTWDGDEIVEVHVDEDGGEERTVTTLDGAGRVASWRRHDVDADHVLELVYTYADDASPLETRVDVRWDAGDASYTAVYEHAWDDAGRRVEAVRTYAFPAGQGFVDREVTTWTCPD